MVRARRHFIGLVGACLLGLAAAPATAQTPDLVPLVRTVTPSVAYVLARDAAGKPFESGTAFAVGSRGVFLTALHVVQDADQITVQSPGAAPLGADVVAVDTHHDVAVLSVPSMPAPGPAPLVLGDSDEIKVGQGVVVVGYPLASPKHPAITVTHGIVSALRTADGYVQIDAAMNPGVSGGPVLTLDGRVIGIADAALQGAQQINFAVAINLARPPVEAVPAAPLGRGAVPLPLTVAAPVSLAYTSGGVGPHSRRDQQGVSCVKPPPNAAELDQVGAELTSEPSLHVVTWLSWAEGAALNSESSFATVDATASHAVGGATQRLHLTPGTVCLNYSVTNSSVIPIGQTFHVTYTLVYRVFRAPTPRAP
jgi:S1-C subfamily serine protease